MLKKIHILPISALLFMMLFVLSQCDVSTNQTQSSDTGTAVVSITDAPLDIENINEVNVRMSDVQIRSAESGESIVLQDEPVSLNIMAFRNGSRQIIAGDNAVANGLYDQLSLQILDITIELNNGDDIDVNVPQAVQDGYTIDFTPNIEVVGNGVTDILLDFDLYQSITQQSDGDTFFPSFSFSPVIRYAILGNTGDISGNIRTENSIVIGNSLVKLFRGSQLLATSFSEPSGNFAIIGIEEGPYTLVASKEGLEADTLDIEVESRGVTETELILDSLSTTN